MEYRVEFEGTSYDLPPYNFDLADKIERVKSADGLKEKCRKIYDLLANDIFNKEKVKELVGEFNNVDPNKLLIMFNDIVMAYTKPLTEKNVKMVLEQLEDSGIERAVELAEKAEKLPKK